MNDMFPEAVVDPTADLDRRYTTRETMDLCMKLAGVAAWDLDVAADEESHWAPTWFDVKTNGLDQPWAGRVWCNPPYSEVEPWVAKAWRAAPECSTIAMLLPCNRTEQPWFHRWVEPFRDNRPARPLLGEPPAQEVLARAFITESVVVDANGCWIWKRYTMPKGHARHRWNGRMELMHRLAYRAWVAEPGDLLVCHRCDVPQCVNPKHLFLGTHKDNMADRNAKARTARGVRSARAMPKETHDLIHARHAAGVQQADIARETGLADSTVSRIINGKRWSKTPSSDVSPGLRFSTHFLPTRVKFGHPGNRDAVGVGSPPFGCMLLVWRRA